MKTTYFKNENLIEFLKTEFKNRNKRNGFRGLISSFFQLFILGIGNYYTKKSWNKTYNSITKNLFHFHEELNCKFKGKKPTLIKFLKEPIPFKFKKAHVGVTKDSIYIFPYVSAKLKDYGSHYDILAEPFRIVYNTKEKTDKYSTIKIISGFKSLKFGSGKTNIEFKTSKDIYELIFDKEIIVFD